MTDAPILTEASAASPCDVVDLWSLATELEMMAAHLKATSHLLGTAHHDRAEGPEPGVSAFLDPTFSLLHFLELQVEHAEALTAKAYTAARIEKAKRELRDFDARR